MTVEQEASDEVTRGTSAGPMVRLESPVSEFDHAQGLATASVTLVEYGDYECPYCLAAVPIVQELQRVLAEQLRYVFRHFPLENLHPHALAAAEAAEAAASQGKFFEMHAVLFEHQTALEHRDLVGYAAGLDLDAARFRSELDSHAHASHVQADFRGGLSSGVRGTPTFFIDGIRYDGVVGVRELLARIGETHPDLIDVDLDAPPQGRSIPRVVHARSPYRTSTD